MITDAEVEESKKLSEQVCREIDDWYRKDPISGLCKGDLYHILNRLEWLATEEEK